MVKYCFQILKGCEAKPPTFMCLSPGGGMSLTSIAQCILLLQWFSRSQTTRSNQCTPIYAYRVTSIQQMLFSYSSLTQSPTP